MEKESGIFYRSFQSILRKPFSEKREGILVMVSIKDVAKKAGVAISTVSKVLNGYPNVSEETKKKVNEAIAELNFVPNIDRKSVV